jgi:hypothetical protein
MERQGPERGPALSRSLMASLTSKYSMDFATLYLVERL